MQALVDSDGNATGVTLGLAGPWGAGKTTILNFLLQEMSEKHPGSIVFKFDPWLVSGRDDLIAAFLTQMAENLSTHSSPSGVFDTRFDQLLAEAAQALLVYGNAASHSLSLVNPLLGPVVLAARSTVSWNAKKRSSLPSLRDKVGRALKDLQRPIIVLIDEIDRLEDDEIHQMAQLVRAVADFDSVSYVLAYDSTRMIEALGNNGLDPEGRRGRGERYLEKIVQIQVGIPILETHQIRALITESVRASLANSQDSYDDVDDRRFKKLLGILVPRAISTPRDIKKILGAFEVKYSMVRGEVNWIDILGMATIDHKADSVSRTIRNKYYLLTYDGHALSPTGTTLDYERNTRSTEEFQRAFPDIRGDWEFELVAFLFPAAIGQSITEQDPRDRISHNRPLVTLLRLAPSPFAFDRQAILRIAELPIGETRREIAGLLSQNKFDIFIARLEEMSFREWDSISGVWRSLISTMELIIPHNTIHILDWREANRSLASSLLRVGGHVQGLDRNLDDWMNVEIRQGSRHVPSQLLYSHFFAYGLYGSRRSFSGNVALSKDSVENLAIVLKSKLSNDLKDPDFVRRMPDAVPYYFLEAVGSYSSQHREALCEFLRDDTDFIDRFVVWFFGGHYSTDLSVLGRFTDLELVKNLTQARVGRADWTEVDAVISDAYHKLNDTAEA